MYRGIVYMLLSSICFAVVNLCIKILSGHPFLGHTFDGFPAHELVFFRSVVSLTLCVIIIKRKKLPLLGNNRKWLLIRGIFGTAALTIFFFTLQNLPMAIAVVLQYFSPIFTIIFAIYLMKEKVFPIQWLFFAISFAGIIFIAFSRGEVGEDIETIWVIMALLSALFAGVAYNAIMKCRNTDAPINVVMYFPLIATPIMGVWTMIEGRMPHGIEWLIILIIGLFTQFAQILMTMSLHADEASKVTPIKYIGGIYALLIGFFFFGEVLSMYSFIGIILILLGILLNAWIKARYVSKNRHSGVSTGR